MTTEIETPTATLPTPETPAIETVDDSPRVDLSQKQMDEIIRRSQGRAASEVRAALADEKKKSAALEAQLAAQLPDATEVERLSAALAMKTNEVESLRTSVTKTKNEGELLKGLTRAGFINPEQTMKLIRDNVDFHADGYTIVDDNGVPLQADSQPVSLDSFLQGFASKNAHLIRGTTRSGTGAEPATRASAQPVPLQRYFGPTSNSREANALALRDPAQYQRLKREAQKAGLV